MARLESTAVAGYYPTPIHLVPRIARLLRAESAGHHTIVDPCAGDGEAVSALARSTFEEEMLRSSRVHVYACELEATRAEGLERCRGSVVPWGAMHVEKGDAFRLQWATERRYGEPRDGAGLLYLNPPYDLDPVHGRLEQRWLARFAPALSERGVLVFVVPFYALTASARTLAQGFRDLRCFRFPAEDFAAFKQVVLVATRCPMLEPDPAVVARVEAWAAGEGLEELADEPVAELPSSGGEGFSEWRIAPLDLRAILDQVRPWSTTDRAGRRVPIPGVLPSEPDLLARTYPLAMPPRAAHIAAGIAAGVFNGARVEPDDAASSLPPLLVKGVFDREFVTVDEKRNKDGDKTGEIQVQQPKLVVTVLDLRSFRYHTIRSSAETTGATDVAEMTTADLLTAYGRGLMRVMLEQCPVLHDPGREDDRVELAALSRPLYRAQAHAAMAAVKLLGGPRASRAERRGKAAFVLGEIGSGKSSVALAVGATIGARRVLVMCPPHLLDSWREQVAAVLPSARVAVLASVSDVDDLVEADDDGTVVAVMSREAAKLGHAWASVGPRCPRCGDDVPAGDLAKQRARCEGRALLPVSALAREARALAIRMLPISPESAAVRQLLAGRHERRILESAAARPRPEQWSALRASGELHALARRLLESELDDAGFSALEALLVAVDDPGLFAEAARSTYARTAGEASYYGPAAERRRRARVLALLVPFRPLLDGTSEQLESDLRAEEGERPSYYGDPWAAWRSAREDLARGENPKGYEFRDLAFKDGALELRGMRPGSVRAALEALRHLAAAGTWRRSKPCGEPLYAAVPEPRRFPLATYVAKRAPSLFDLLVLDEGHEYAGDGSAQGFAAHRLTGLGVPTLLLTGSVMNGYADSMFVNQWALDPRFREEFSRDQRAEFVRRYGYLKQLVELRDSKGERVTFGAVSDRVERTARTVGQAPGVLPLFVLRYLLRLAVTLHKSDLALDLPPRRDVVELVQPSPHQKAEFERLKAELVAQIRKDQFGELAGKLFGQLSELPSYLDRATSDVGNDGSGAYVVAYPEAAGGGVVAEAKPLPADTILPKERWMLDAIRREVDEGRNVMVFAWHVSLLPRVARLVERELGLACPVLDANKVSAAKRQAWIDREVVRKKRRVLVVNPIAVQTGLNNLVWFSTEIWLENPACNPIAFRQATGRIDRIGQTKETRILFPVYAGTLQENLHRLLLHKVGVSMATDGLDAESALQAAGVGEANAMSALSVGRQLYEIITSAA